MATATAPALEQLRKEITVIESDVASLRSKLSVAESKLTANQAEQVEVSEAIARGKRKPSDSVALLRQGEEILASVAGLRGLIAKNQVQLDELYPMMRRQETEALTAARKAEVETLRQKGAVVVERINEKIRAIIMADLPELDGIRDRLAAGELRDMGGQQLALQMIRTLTDEKGVLAEEFKLTDSRDWARHPAAWDVRGDLILTLRNLRKS